MGKAFDSVDGNMDILMYNNTVKKIKDVRKGDTVFSVRYDGEAYQYVKGEVTSVNKRKGKAVKITLNDEYVAPYPIGCTVLLSTGQQGSVIKNDDKQLFRPQVKLANGSVVDLMKKLDVTVLGILN